MQFLLIDLALVLLAVLGYRALNLAARYRAAVVTLDHRVMLHPVKPVRREPMAPKPASCGDQCRTTLHRLINFW